MDKPKEGATPQFIDRMIRAAKLDVNLYEEVEHDASSMKQAMGIVVVSSIAAGIGSLSLGVGWIVFGTVRALLVWYLWSYIAYLVGAKLIPEPQTKTDYGEMLRTIGFSSSPGIIRILGIIPGLGRMVFFISNMWMLVAMVIAIRQALDYKSTGRAIGVVVVGWIFAAILLAVFLSLAGAGQ